MLRILAALLILCTTPLLRGQSTQTVVCFGDSLTFGTGAPAGTSYPDDLRKALAQAGYHVDLINQGVAGDTTKDGLARMADVLRIRPAIVILELGANDGLRGQPVPGIVHNLTTMIDTFQRAHIRVLLAGIDLPPNLGPEYVKQFDAMYPSLAQKYKLPLIPFLLQDVYGVEGMMSSDYLHPNAAGYLVVTRNVLSYLEPMLGK